MEVRILGATQFWEDTTVFNNIKEKFEKLAGYSAGVCYMSDSIDAILAETEKRTLARIKRTLESNHHSVYDHPAITFYLGGIPKAFAMLLNNERFMVTSEKSARYTQMKLDGKEVELYYKWKEIVRTQIDKVYGDSVPFLADKKDKLAQENARYFTGVFNPNTSMVHTVTFRQLNYLYSWMQNLMATEKPNLFYKMMFPAMKDFCSKIEEYDLVEPLLVDGKGWKLSLIKDEKYPDTFTPGVYCTTYLGTLAQLAQAHRHRTIDYSMSIPKDFSAYIPPIIASNSELVEDWMKDIKSVREVFPQGMNVSITERGMPEDLIRKADERICSYTQLEISEQTRKTLKTYVQEIESVDKEQADIMNRYVKGARCTAGSYKCNKPCGWSEGIKGIRMI